MNDPRAESKEYSTNPPSTDLTSAPIQTQLLWSSLFPLVLFGLLSILVTASALYHLTQNLVKQRNSSQVQTLAASLAPNMTGGKIPDQQELLADIRIADTEKSVTVYIINDRWQPVVSSDTSADPILLSTAEFKQISQNSIPYSTLISSSITNDEVMASAAAIPGTGYSVVMVEPWLTIMAPAANYQFLLAVLAVLGIGLSLTMLSVTINRIIQPIQILSEIAAGAVPGSVFHPIKEYGAVEIRKLINAFNRMVISLAEQQSALQQYAHKALLSQEEERQRLSHELHDGTLQDLVGLSQRVELCQNELDIDPQLAHERLNEIHDLLNQALQDVRRISIALRPPVLEDFGLVVAIDALCQEMNQYKSSLLCEFKVSGESRRLIADMELAVYRVVQEALTNIRKHAPDATQVTVVLEFTDTEVLARISNNGSVFSNQGIQEYVHDGHLGLAGMHERARLFGGEFSIESSEDQKTVITIHLPISEEMN
jgi:signal transduction histidine kinase